MNLKRLGMALFLFAFFTQPIVAKPQVGHKMRRALNTVTLNLSEQQWVKTDSAKLSVSINATLNNKNLATARATLLNDLRTIANGDWHISEFNRSQDSSGMAKLYAKATIRIAQNKLTNVYQQAKAISKAGLQYSISGIEFTPSFSEMNKARSSLRDIIYKNITNEVEGLNKTYPKQNFTLYKVVFSEGAPVAASRNIQPLMLARTAKMSASSETSYQLTLHAFIILAANRQFP